MMYVWHHLYEDIIVISAWDQFSVLNFLQVQQLYMSGLALDKKKIFLQNG